MTKLLTIFFLCFCLAHRALAWNAVGHMVVSQIAYNHLDPFVKAKCDALIGVPLAYGSTANNTFVTAAVWADDHKSSLGTGIWHYIDLPFSLDGTTTNNVVADPYDVVQAINQCVTTLQSGTADQTNQATCLRYLLHFVGDIQQPLHCSTAVSITSPTGDAGGNSFSVGGGIWSNLHSLWDAGGGYLTNSISRPLTANGQTALAAKAAAAETNSPFVANVGTVPNAMVWAQEGLSLAKTVSYVGITRGSTPTANYLNTAQATTEQRMAEGGHRLANLLNTIFAARPVPLTPLAITNGKFSFAWSTVSNTTYRVQWKQQLTDPAWNDLASITNSSNPATFAETLSQTQRFYRVVQ